MSRCCPRAAPDATTPECLAAIATDQAPAAADGFAARVKFTGSHGWLNPAARMCRPTSATRKHRAASAGPDGSVSALPLDGVEQRLAEEEPAQIVGEQSAERLPASGIATT